MYRILVVDDEQSILKALSMGLSSEDFEVDVAPDGTSGILLGGRKEYDILIADLFSGFSREKDCRAEKHRIFYPDYTSHEMQE